MLIRQNLPTVKQQTHSIRPDFIAESVADIDFPFLASLGIKACFIDLDGTVVPRGTFAVDDAIIDRLKTAALPIYIATNRPKSRELKNLKQDLSAAGVIHPAGVYAKPTRRYYRAALAVHGLRAHEVVMVGDRYLQDIFGANRAGLYTMVVHKNGVSVGRLDRLLSKIEAKVTQTFTGKYRNL